MAQDVGQIQISIHAPAKGATDNSDITISRLIFQSTLPRRERRKCVGVGSRAYHFNPRSREGSDIKAGSCKSVQRNFNPRSREGSDAGRLSISLSITISIHAPAKGATTAAKSCPLLLLFQSTLPRRERRTGCGAAGAADHFNPRSREGSDVTSLRLLNVEREFQSTLPRRERPSRGRCARTSCHFNPRSREGSDHAFRVSRVLSPLISIHAPAKGATESVRVLFQSSAISIHAPAKGATMADSPMRRIAIFQSTLPRRERRYEMVTSSAGMTFQSTLPRRERPRTLTRSPFSPTFQSTLPRRERRKSQPINPLSLYFNPRSREGSDPQCKTL